MHWLLPRLKLRRRHDLCPFLLRTPHSPAQCLIAQFLDEESWNELIHTVEMDVTLPSPVVSKE